MYIDKFSIMITNTWANQLTKVIFQLTVLKLPVYDPWTPVFDTYGEGTCQPQTTYFMVRKQKEWTEARGSQSYWEHTTSDLKSSSQGLVSQSFHDVFHLGD